MGRNKEVTVESVYDGYNQLSLEKQIELLKMIENDLSVKKIESRERSELLDKALNGKHQ